MTVLLGWIFWTLYSHISSRSSTNCWETLQYRLPWSILSKLFELSYDKTFFEFCEWHKANMLPLHKNCWAALLTNSLFFCLIIYLFSIFQHLIIIQKSVDVSGPLSGCSCRVEWFTLSIKIAVFYILLWKFQLSCLAIQGGLINY